MCRMFTTKTAKLFELQTLRSLLLVLISDVIAVFAIAALQYDIVSHNSFQFPVSSFQSPGFSGFPLKTEN
jgi:hypothetical protein